MDRGESEGGDKGMCQLVEGMRKRGWGRKKEGVWKEKEQGMMGKCSNLKN